MSDQAETISNVDIDLTGANISRPYFDNQVIRCQIGEVAYKKNGDRVRLEVPLVFQTAAKAQDGREVTPGFKHTDSITVTAAGGRTKERIAEDIARLQAAALGLSKPKDGLFDKSEIVGKMVDVKFSTRTDGDKVYQDCRYLAVK